MFEFKFEAMGTELEIKIFNSVSKILEEKIKSEIFDFTVWYDNTFSRFKKYSLVTKLSEQTGHFKVPKDFVKILDIYKNFYTITNRSMNPLIGNTLSDLGYDAEYSLTKKEIIRQTPGFFEALEILDSENIFVKEKVLIDIGAVGKGFWVDKVREILEQNKITNFLINGSGDIYFESTETDKANIWLENSENKIFAKTEILNESICGSGTSKRNWSIKKEENLHHIIDAKTGKSTKNILSVWIKIPKTKYSTTLADGLATAIFFVEPEELQKKIENIFEIDFEYFIIYTDKKILFSKNFNVEFLKN